MLNRLNNQLMQSNAVRNIGAFWIYDAFRHAGAGFDGILVAENSIGAVAHTDEFGIEAYDDCVGHSALMHAVES